jgi:small subunit ribosomal protein S21
MFLFSPIMHFVFMTSTRRIDSALRRFKREVNKSGHLIELRHKRFHESSQEKVKRKAAQARLRKRFERMQKRRMQQQNRV